MRGVQMADLEMAMRVLTACPQAVRDVTAQKLVARAEVADRHRKRCGCAHPAFGDGTLLAAAMTRNPAQRRAFLDADSLDCLQQLIAALREKM